MSESRDLVDKLITGLKQQRDELKLQMHLGKEELKGEWDKVEGKLSKLSDDFEPVKDAIEESAESVFASLKLVAGEIKQSFDRIRDVAMTDKQDT
jgi:hypothetical protein